MIKLRSSQSSIIQAYESHTCNSVSHCWSVRQPIGLMVYQLIMQCNIFPKGDLTRTRLVLVYWFDTLAMCHVSLDTQLRIEVTNLDSNKKN